LFKLFKKKEKIKVEVHNRLIDIRIGRSYARGQDMDGNPYECFDKTAAEIYDRYVESSDSFKAVDKLYFIEGYDLQTKELSYVIKTVKKIKN
jgi:hypothetical protein